MGRSPCCDESGLKKGPWTQEEDQKLVNYIEKHGHGSWRALPKLAGLNRCGKSCRLRWTNYLRPGIKRGKFSQEEEQTILNLHAILGNKWSAIASHLPGRTDNEIKNFWNTHLKKKLIHMGYDPITHQPRTDIFSGLSQLLALATLKELLDHHHPLDQNAAILLQAEAIQLARLQYFQQQQQQQLLQQPHHQLDADTNKNTMNNNLSSDDQFENTISSSIGIISDLKFDDNDSIIPFSHMPELKTYEQPLLSSNNNKEMVHHATHHHESIALCNGESSPNSPWLLSCSSTTPSTPNSHVVPAAATDTLLVTENCPASTIWPELLVEDPLFNVIS
ncbi:hypothetical protein RIF29_16166 [Crotalaria pallida]|uniref:Uncharacterized protein n=1 Tax=Crotalaria pallida TaxID=3830 RepID=A0AAN9FG49_CROPI